LLSQKAGGSGNLRVKISLSDGRTDVMEFSSDISVTTFLTLLSEKFNVSISNIHSIRSGHPPKILDQTRPQSVVQFENGDRVQVVLSTKMDIRESPERTSPKRDFIEAKIPSDVQGLWDYAQHQDRNIWNVLLDDIKHRKFTSLFNEGGGYSKLMRLQKGRLYRTLFVQDKAQK